jgi:hypothetical protein
MKSITKICLILIAATAMTSLPASAQTTDTTTNTAPSARKNPRPGYRGKISAVDSANMTLTVIGRSGAEFKLKITSKTKITKGNEPGTFADAAEGLNATGRGTKDADGNWEATTLHITTPQPPPAAKPPAATSGQ